MRWWTVRGGWWGGEGAAWGVYVPNELEADSVTSTEDAPSHAQLAGEPNKPRIYERMTGWSASLAGDLGLARW